MSQTARRAYTNLPTMVGSGGVPSERLPGRKGESARQPSIDQTLAGSSIMLGTWLAIGTGSLLVGPAYPASNATTFEHHLSWPTGIGVRRRAPQSDTHAVWKVQLEKIKREFAISTTHLARFLRVERPTVYQWFGNSEPRQRNLHRIGVLAELAEQWSRLQLGSVRPYLELRATNDDGTLDNLLSSDHLRSDILVDAFERVAKTQRAIVSEKGSLADQLAARGFTPYDEETQKRSRAVSTRSTSPGEDSA